MRWEQCEPILPRDSATCIGPTPSVPPHPVPGDASLHAPPPSDSQVSAFLRGPTPTPPLPPPPPLPGARPAEQLGLPQAQAGRDTGVRRRRNRTQAYVTAPRLSVAAAAVAAAAAVRKPAILPAGGGGGARAPPRGVGPAAGLCLVRRAAAAQLRRRLPAISVPAGGLLTHRAKLPRRASTLRACASATTVRLQRRLLPAV